MPPPSASRTQASGIETSAPPAPPVPPPSRPAGERPQRIVMPPDVKLNAQPLGKITEEPASVETIDALYTGEESAPPLSPSIPPTTRPVVPPPDVTEEQVRADLDTLFEKKLLCAGCGRQAGDHEEFSPGRAGLLCPACRAAEESVNNFAQPSETKSAIDWGAAQAASGRRREDELREIATNGKRQATGADTRFTTFPVLREAWEKLKGVKRDVWGAVAIIVLVNLILGASSHFLPGTKTGAGVIGIGVVSVIAFFLNSLLLSGLGYLGLCQARGEEGGWDTMFVCFNPINLAKLLLLFIILPIVVGLGLICLIVPGIYLAVTLSFSPLLVLDKGMWPWEAMRESWRESHANCLNIFLIYLVAKVAFWAAVIFLLVGLFWMLPFVFVLYGVLYRRLFDGA